MKRAAARDGADATREDDAITMLLVLVSFLPAGGRAVVIFAAPVIAGEVATKFLLVRMLGGLTAAGAPGAGVPGGS